MGGDGDDSIIGGGGNDTLTGGSGNDTFDGGIGTDTITDFNPTEDTLTVPANGTTIITSTNATSDYSAIENKGVLSITVSVQTDATITGTTGINSIVGASGNDTISGGTSNDTLIGGAGNDSITGNDGIDLMTGGAGDDTFAFSGSLDTKSPIYTDVITDFKSGSDKISGFGVDGNSENVFFADKSIDSLTNLLKNADDKLDGAIKFYVGQVIGTTDAYLVTDNDGLGYTHVIKLIGVTLTTFLSSDIIP
jgi:Ca2+-binding RTX toxin-like protein